MSGGLTIDFPATEQCGNVFFALIAFRRCAGILIWAMLHHRLGLRCGGGGGEGAMLHFFFQRSLVDGTDAMSSDDFVGYTSVLADYYESLESLVVFSSQNIIFAKSIFNSKNYFWPRFGLTSLLPRGRNEGRPQGPKSGWHSSFGP